MKKLLFISLFAALLAAGCSKDEGPGGQGPKIPDNEIWYTSSDGEIVEPNKFDNVIGVVDEGFGEGVKILSNTYENGKGVIKFNAPVTEIGVQTFYYRSRLTSITIPNSVTSIGGYSFWYCSFTSITIPDNVTTIGDMAFCFCSGLTSVTIPDSVTSIGIAPFDECPITAFYGKFASEDNRCLIVDGVLNSFTVMCGATEYTIPDGVTEIGVDAFSSCGSLVSITIPDSVTTIGADAFWSCVNLTNVTIPDSVTEIGAMAFAYCGLTSVYCMATTPPNMGRRVFYDNFSSNNDLLENLTAIYVPRASVEAYKAAENWSEYADLIQPYDF